MENDIYFESVHVSCKTINNFEQIYNNMKKDIMNDLRKELKEKYNIDINGIKLSENTAITTAKYNHTTPRE